MTAEILILAAARTAIGGFGGALKNTPAWELGAIVFKDVLQRTGVSAEAVEHAVLGNVIPSTPADAYVSRVAAVRAGVPIAAPALTVNRLCGSGLQAVVSAAQLVALGEAEIVLAGGAENMSQAPHHVTAARFGQKMGDMQMLDALTGTLSDPFEHYHMGVTAEQVARKCGVTRDAQDRAALESHRRAARAIDEGRFRSQIVPVPVRRGKDVQDFAVDEHVRRDVDLDGLASLRPVFAKDGTVTAGNASGINDGAGAVLLGSRAAAERQGLRPMARILGWGHAGVEPGLMGLGPVAAVPVALRRAGVSIEQIDVIESNEAFAAQSCAVAAQLGFDPARTNINGSGISLGHPVGATGAINLVKCLYELDRSGGRFGLVTMCIGGGQGIAMVVERIG